MRQNEKKFLYARQASREAKDRSGLFDDDEDESDEEELDRQ